MSGAGKEILTKYKQHWKLLLLVEVTLYSLGFAVLGYFTTQDWVYTLGFFVAVLLISLLILKPWRVTLTRVVSYMDQRFEKAECSTGLLLLNERELPGLAQLQRAKVTNYLTGDRKISPPNHIARALLVLCFCFLTGLLIHGSGVTMLDTWGEANKEGGASPISFAPSDSSFASSSNIPAIKTQSVYIKYPAYTRMKPYAGENMNVKAVEGSIVTWSVSFDKPVKKVLMESGKNEYEMRPSSDRYKRSVKLSESGFYNFLFFDHKDQSYTSPIYKIEVVSDKKPVIAIEGIRQFTSFDYKDTPIIHFNTAVTDDFGVSDATIIATVSKGSGESVKFREERLPFDEIIKPGQKSLLLKKSIDLNQMKMTPGDELYFYVEATDNKQPMPNTVRSETYFAVIKDTVSYEFSLEGSLGVDLMPEYFRSQRQLIIDTEKLIKNKPEIAKNDFNFTSNELGYDQKALRLKYGQFMGEEFESGIAINESEAEEIGEGEHGEHDEADPLKEYTHDHDGDNEHNLVEPDQSDEKEDPLHDYVHDHDDPEESTLYTASIRSKLRQAMNEMWDAELYLRLYQPEKSLPYQYRALKLIKEIKNDARIYVHRIGFDPPPIKEEKRLTGDISEVDSNLQREDAEKEEPYPNIRKCVAMIEGLINSRSYPSKEDRGIFSQAGNELAGIAIESPVNYLQTLANLKKLANDEVDEKDFVNMLQKVQKDLRRALPVLPESPGLVKHKYGELEEMFLEELQQLRND